MAQLCSTLLSFAFRCLALLGVAQLRFASSFLVWLYLALPTFAELPLRLGKEQHRNNACFHRPVKNTSILKYLRMVPPSAVADGAEEGVKRRRGRRIFNSRPAILSGYAQDQCSVVNDDIVVLCSGDV